MLLVSPPVEVLERVRRSVPEGSPGREAVARSMDSMARSGAHVVHAGSTDFPHIVDEIPDPPAILFFRGDAALFTSRPAVAIIGSRRASRYGLRVARSLSAGIAVQGVGVVSGLARGIDGEAHRGCLDAGGLTMAVLGSGIDVIYPPEHAELAAEISRHGAVVSEFPPGTAPDAFNFPTRNRLISGFSQAVVVVEAGDRSGTMITVDAALEQGRDVFAVPGEITRAGSRGTNRLIREGAMVATRPSDILEAIGVSVRADAGSGPVVDGEAAPVLSALADGPAHFDELVRATGTAAAELQSALLLLELSGRVVKRQGGFYSLP